MRRCGLVRLALSLMLLACFQLPAIAQMRVVYPSSVSDMDVRHNDLIELLTTALETTRDQYGDYTIGPSRYKMNEARSLVELSTNEQVTVVWSPTAERLEQDYIPVRIPLRKGLIGMRIALINAANQGSIDRVQTQVDLQQKSIGMGIGWLDVGILQFNHMHVMTATYDALFAMTAHERFDLFPRGLNEVFNEFEQRSPLYPELAVEKHLLIYYPLPYYFFVNLRNPELAERIRVGLERMIDDGRFDKIFLKFNGEAIRRADLAHRHIISIPNPFLPKDTPLDARYWLFPELVRKNAGAAVRLAGEGVPN